MSKFLRNLFPAKLKNLSAAVSSLALMLSATLSHATVYYWDPQGSATPTTNNLGVTWVTNAAQWSSTSALSATPVALPASIAVCFCAGATTITNPITITLNTPVNIPGFFNGPLAPAGFFITIAGTGSINIPSGASGFDNGGSDGGTSTFAVPITGIGPVALEGSTQFYFNATNTYTGGTMLGYAPSANYFTSIINFNNPGAFGTGPIIGQGSSSAMVVESNIVMTLTNAFILTNGVINIVPATGGLTLSGPISVPSTGLAGIGTGSPTTGLLVISGVISGGGSFLKYNGSPMVLSGSNTYGGATLISNAGPLVVTQDANLGGGSGITMYAGTTLTASNSFQLNSGRTLLLLGSATINVASGKTLTNSASITGSFALTKAGAGIMLLDASEGYSGNTTVSAGTLKLTGNGNIPSTNVAVAAGATLDISALGGYDFDAQASSSSPQTLSVTGTTSAATLVVSTFGGAIIGSSSPLNISYKSSSSRGDTAHPALTVTGGPLTLDGCTITISNALGTNFGPGTYTIIKSASGGSLITNAPPAIMFTGLGVATNCTGVLQFVTNSLQLVVTIPASTITGVTQGTNGLITVTGSGLSGSPYRLASATNLTPPVTWTILATNVANSNGVITLTDTNAATLPARFYRIDY